MEESGCFMKQKHAQLAFVLNEQGEEIINPQRAGFLWENMKFAFPTIEPFLDTEMINVIEIVTGRSQGPGFFFT